MSENSTKVLSGRLKSLKGWLSKTISACNNLVEAPRSLASDSFLKSRLEKSVTELDGRLQTINDCIAELEALELTKPFDDDRKKREESFNLSSAQAASSHQACLNKLLEALAELETRANPEVTTPPVTTAIKRYSSSC